MNDIKGGLFLEGFKERLKKNISMIEFYKKSISHIFSFADVVRNISYISYIYIYIAALLSSYVKTVTIEINFPNFISHSYLLKHEILYICARFIVITEVNRLNNIFTS